VLDCLVSLDLCQEFIDSIAFDKLLYISVERLWDLDCLVSLVLCQEFIDSIAFDKLLYISEEGRLILLFSEERLLFTDSDCFFSLNLYQLFIDSIAFDKFLCISEEGSIFVIILTISLCRLLRCVVY